MMFTSGTLAIQGREIRYNGKPWTLPNGDGPGMECAPWTGHKVVDNPILAEVRLNCPAPEYDGWTAAVAAHYYLNEVLADAAHTAAHGWTLGMVNHARRVLEKLVAVYT